MEAWIQTVRHLATEMATAHRVSEIAAIGIGLGGLLALHAADLGAPIGQVALWGTPASGHRLVRELQASAALVPPPVGAEPVNGAEGWIELTGYILTEATRAGLRAIDLSEGRQSAPRRVLLLGRDGIAVDQTFVEALRSAGAEVTLADGMGFGPMMADPEKSRLPEETIATTCRWLGDDPACVFGSSAGAPPTALPGDGELIATVGGRAIAERAVSIPAPGGDIFGMLCTPCDGLTAGAYPSVAALLLNGGAQRHIGQNRNWVETARRWAAHGLSSLRIDLPGMGDAGGQAAGPLSMNDIYSPLRTEQVLSTLAWMREQRIGDRFVLSGLCAGAYWAWHAAVADESIAGVGLINMFAFDWNAELGHERASRVTLGALRGQLWHKLRHSQRRRHAIARSLRSLTAVRALRHARRGRLEQTDRIGTALTELNARGCEVAFLTGLREPISEELASFGVLERLDQWEHIRTQDFDWEDHAVRALASQRLVAEWLDNLLERVIAGRDSERPVTESAATPHR